jgi:hypothetical protein
MFIECKKYLLNLPITRTLKQLLDIFVTFSGRVILIDMYTINSPISMKVPNQSRSFSTIRAISHYLIVLCFSITLLSCSKKEKIDPAPAGDFMKFKADGKEYFIRNESSVGYVTSSLNLGNGSGGYSLGVSGLQAPGPYPSLGFLIKSKSRFETREYKSDDVANEEPNFLMIFVLPIADVQKKYQQYQINKGITFTITEITVDRVKGTFSSKAITDPLYPAPAITDGEFSAKRTD